MTSLSRDDRPGKIIHQCTRFQTSFCSKLQTLFNTCHCRECHCETSTCQIGICSHTEAKDFDRTHNIMNETKLTRKQQSTFGSCLFITFCKTSIEQTFWGFVTIYLLETSPPLGNCYVHNPCSLSVQASQTLNASGLLKKDRKEKNPHLEVGN